MKTVVDQFEKECSGSTEKQGEFGVVDIWTWIGIDTDTNLVPCRYVGRCNVEATYEFITI